MTIDKLDPKGLEAQLRAAYEKVAAWPENRMTPGAVVELGEGFMDLLKLRNLMPQVLAILASTAGVPGETPRVTEAKPIGYAIADYFEDRRAEYEQNGTVIYAAPAGMATTPVYLSSPPVSQQAEAVAVQDRVQPWMMACFGSEISGDCVERADRLLEEVFELLQSGGYDPARVLSLRDYVWGREIGEPTQEVGGVMVTLAAYCLAHGLDMHAAGETELARIWTKVEKIRAKQAAKPRHSPLPVEASPAPDAVEPVAWVRMKTLDPSKPLKATTIKDIADGWMKAGHKVKPLVIRSALHTSPVSAPGVVE